MKYNPPKPALPKVHLDEGDGNALWRLSTFFPSLSEDLLANLRLFHQELLKFNLKINLISRNTERQADLEHFADCLFAADIILKRSFGPKVFDIGSGNGFPGLILAILDPNREYHLVESDNRKCEFLKHVAHLLKLKNVVVNNIRFESLNGAGVDVGLCRGFASISKTLLACNKIYEKGGQFIHLKGPNWSSEIADLPSQLISVWRPELAGEYNLPVTQARRAIVVTYKVG